MNLHHIFFFLVLAFFISNCTGRTSKELSAVYQNEIEDWKKSRLSELQRPDGWPTLVGLYWIEEGMNSFGSNPLNQIRFPDAMPDHIGEIELHNDKLHYYHEPNIGVMHNGHDAVSGELSTDVQENTTYINWKSYQWHIIHRGGRYGIRLKDTLHSARMMLKEIPSYPVNRIWRKKAIYTKAGPEDIVAMKNQVNMKIPYTIDGYLSFEHHGATYQLIALDGGPDLLFVIISDETTGNDTYGGGRYLYVPRADSNGNVTLDFNKAINPPCVFTDFATCLLPPKENELPFSVLAGEKMYGHH